MINRIKGKLKILLGKLILLLAEACNLELLSLAYRQIGITKSENDFVSGEIYVINFVLGKLISPENKASLFDIGANVGTYTQKLNIAFPNATIYAFEPNLQAYKGLERNLIGTNSKSFQLCLGSVLEKKKIYSYSNHEDSQHATLYKEVMTDLHGSSKLVEFECQSTTLDLFCQNHGISFIDFMKIDVEGHEYDVLLGSKNLLKSNKIGIIQFEFNEMNIISRTFLKDFSGLLFQYSLYRIDTRKLIPITPYKAVNEIFAFQNILAINKVIFPYQFG